MKALFFSTTPNPGNAKSNAAPKRLHGIPGLRLRFKPQLIDFGANPFDGNEQIDLMVVAGGDGTVNYVVTP